MPRGYLGCYEGVLDTVQMRRYLYLVWDWLQGYNRNFDLTDYSSGPVTMSIKKKGEGVRTFSWTIYQSMSATD